MPPSLLEEDSRNAADPASDPDHRDNARRLDAMVKILQLNRRDRTQPEAIPLSGYLTTFSEELSQTERMPAGCIVVDAPQDLSITFRLRPSARCCGTCAATLALLPPATGQRYHFARRDRLGAVKDVCDDGPWHRQNAARAAV